MFFGSVATLAHPRRFRTEIGQDPQSEQILLSNVASGNQLFVNHDDAKLVKYKKYMVYTAAGDHSHVAQWLQCGEPQFTTFVSFYGEDARQAERLKKLSTYFQYAKVRIVFDFKAQLHFFTELSVAISMYGFPMNMFVLSFKTLL